MTRKNIIVLFILFFSLSFSFTDVILLNDDSYIKCKVVGMNKTDVYFTVNKQKYQIKVNNINYLIPQLNKRKNNIIKVTLVNGDKITGTLIRFFENSMVIDQKLELYTVELLDNIDEIVFKGSASVVQNQMYLKCSDILNDEIKKLMFAFTHKPSLYSTLDENDRYFYDSFWDIVSPYLDDHAREKIWALLEIYNKKELSLNDILNVERKSKAIELIDQKIISLRSEFFKRCRLIILAQI